MIYKIHPNPVAKIFFYVFMGLVISTIIFYIGENYFWIIALPLWGFVFLLSLLSFIRSRFVSLEVGADEIIYKRGILSVNRIHVPFSKITSINTSQTVIERLFGIGTLQIDTAGGPKAEVVLLSIPMEASKRLNSQIKEKEAKNSSKREKVEYQERHE